MYKKIKYVFLGVITEALFWRNQPQGVSFLDKPHDLVKWWKLLRVGRTYGHCELFDSLTDALHRHEIFNNIQTGLEANVRKVIQPICPP